MENLSRKDANVLSALFDPEASPSALHHHPIDDDAPPFPGVTAEQHATLQGELAALLSPVKDATTTTTTTPDDQRAMMAAAQVAVSSFIDRHPGYAPGYVDRAQLLRLSLPPDSLFVATTTDATADGPHAETSRQILRDLSEGISLASPRTPTASPTTTAAVAVSPQQSALLASAHTHRGLLLLRVAELLRRRQEDAASSLVVVAGAPSEDPAAVEERASKDFAAAARYGGRLARELSVRTNPYAKMCGAVVRGAVREERMREARQGARRVEASVSTG